MRIATLAAAVLAAVFATTGAAPAAQPAADTPPRRAVGPGDVVVHSALGGFILGYDIDQDGTEGLLSEALTRADGRHDIAVETFDQTTGRILRIVRSAADSKDSFSTLGIFAGHAGLVEFEHSRGLFVDRRSYPQLVPLDANAFTGRWTPPFGAAEDIITSAATEQQSPVTAFLGMHNVANDFSSRVFSSDVAANTFGPVIRIDDPVFDWNLSPVIAMDSGANQAVLGSSLGCFGCSTRIGLVDLATGALTTFKGRGFGSINGIAVDSQTGMACTTTEDDFSVEFYDLRTHRGTRVTLPGATSQAQSGGAVAVDPLNHLFLVGQEFSSTAASGSSLHVYGEQGQLVESLNGFQLPASAARIALNPARRTGFVIVTPALTSLQSFSY